MRTFGKGRLLRSTVLAGFAATALGGAAFGQDADDPEETDEEDEEAEEADRERITVTGSRVSRSEYTTPSPIQIIDGEISRDLGIIDAADFLNQTTVVQGQQTTIGLSTVVANTQAFTTIGSVTPSFRGLSSSVTGRVRNLVLIDGRRYGPIGVGGAPANPDVSFIPGSMIERVEVLLDGASSVYGSDAIAGVANYILREDFEGFEVDAYYSMPEIGPGQQTVLSAIAGIGSDRGNITVAFEMNQSNRVTRQSRFDRIREEIDFFDQPDVSCPYDIEIRPDGSTGAYCSGSLVGYVIDPFFQGYAPTPGTTVGGVPGYTTLSGGLFPDEQDDLTGLGSDYPQNMGSSFLPEVDRYTFFANGYYNVGGVTNAEVYFNASYSERDLESFNDGFQLALPIPNTLRTVDNDGNLILDGGGNPVRVRNPLLPAGFLGAGENLLLASRQSDIRQNINVSRIVGGVRGDLPWLENSFMSNWSYDISATYHRSNGNQEFRGDPIINHLTQNLNAVVRPDGSMDCRLPNGGGANGFGLTQPSSPCRIVNFYDPQFILTGRFSDPADNEYLYGSRVQNTQVEQTLISGFITGELGAMPWASSPVGAVIGLEYRDDEVKTITDPLTAIGGFESVDADVGSNGRRYLTEAFAELVVPLVEGRQFVERLAVEGAVRWTEEENFGAYVTWQAKGLYEPTDWLALSAGYGTSFRAPDTGEQFGTGTAFSRFSRIDPCLPNQALLETDINGNFFYDVANDERSQTLLDNCVGLGIDVFSQGFTGLGTPSVGIVSDPVLFSNAGSTDVGPETSEAWFAKVTANYTIPGIEVDLQGSVNYFDYLVEDAIGQLDAGQILNECLDSVGLSSPFCVFQIRDSSGNLVEVNEASINLGAITSRGIDFNLQASKNFGTVDIDGFGPVGEYISSNPLSYVGILRLTESLENQEDLLGDGTFEDNLGLFGFPELQANLTNIIRLGDWSVSHRVRFISDQDSNRPPLETTIRSGTTEFCGDLLDQFPNANAGDPQICSEATEPGRFFQHDLTLSYNNDTWAVRGGVRNLLDEFPVLDDSAAGDDQFPQGLGLTNGLGRTFFVNVTKAF